MEKEELWKILREIHSSYSEGSKEKEALNRAVDALVFSESFAVRQEFSKFLERKKLGATDKELAFYRKMGWIDED